MDKEYVYGIFINDGDGEQLLYHFGLFTSEEKACKFLDEQYPNGWSQFWIDKVELKTCGKY